MRRLMGKEIITAANNKIIGISSVMFIISNISIKHNIGKKMDKISLSRKGFLICVFNHMKPHQIF